MRIEYESNEIPIYRTITEDNESVETPEDIQTSLIQIAEDLGYTYIEKTKYKLGQGNISVRNDVDIIIKYGTKINSIYVTIGRVSGSSYKAVMYNSTTNSSDIDDVSVALQTASMICDEIRKKLM